MALNDVEEDLPYTMGRLIAGARKKKNISLEELSQGVMSAEDLNFIEKDDEYADKTTWDFLLGRLGISPLIYECYVEQEEYDLFKARKEMREISNQIISNGLMSNERLRSKNTAQLKLLADQLEKRSQKYAALLNNVKNITAAIHQIFLANMKGYVILAKQRGELCKADALKLHMESEWKRIYSSDAVSWIQKPHNVLMAVYEQEMLFLLAQGYEENGEIEKAIQILTWLWQQRKKGGDPEENTRVLSFAAWKLAALEWNINRQEKAMEICQEAIDRSIQAESFRGLLPLLKQRLFFEKQLKCSQEEWDEQEKTIGVIDELFAEFHENPYGLFVLTTFENARIADEIIRIRRKEQNLTQTKLSEGILEPESYSRFECGKRKLRWAKKKKLLERLGERGNKVTLLLESDDPDVVEEYQRIQDSSYREKYDLLKEKIYDLKGKLDKTSKINRQFILHMQNNIDVRFFQILERKQIKMKRQKEIKETASKFDTVSIQEHGWSRTEIAIIKNIANAYRDDKKVEIAISILRKAIESFDKETIGQESACLGKQLLWETLATYLGDVEKYEDAIFYAKKGMKKILESGSAKGISGELYEIAWNERERKAKPEIYQKKYFQALKFTILFQEREFIIFLKQREQEYKK
ncbi:XRE family transcriptional regulator [Firmicutes bacterium AF25-13AC]|nr:XRE family transcriptional regulator [Firmicutes bacterium AF25-13AC]